MIYDNFTNFDRYSFVAPEVWNKVKSFIINATACVDAGKYLIFNENCFANVAKYMPQELDENKLEAHREYLDIQLTLKGVERIYCREIGDLDEVVEFSESKDVGFYKMREDKVTSLDIGEGYFAIFYPHEGHLPGCVVDGKEGEVIKIIIKIHRSYLA